MSSNSCGSTMGDYSINIKHIKVYLWITDLVSVYNIEKLTNWLFNITENRNILNNDVARVNTSEFQYYVMGYYGQFFVKSSHKFVDIRLDKLATDKHHFYDIVVTGSDKEMGDHPFGLSVIIETHSAQAELLYFSTHVEFIMKIPDLSTYRRISLQILNAPWIKLTYKYMKFLRQGFHHSQYYLGCKPDRLGDHEAIVCSKRITLNKLKGSIIASYNVENKDFYQYEKQMDIPYTLLGGSS